MSFDMQGYQRSYKEKLRRLRTKKMTPLAARCFLNDLDRSRTGKKRKPVASAKPSNTKRFMEAK